MSTKTRPPRPLHTIPELRTYLILRIDRLSNSQRRHGKAADFAYLRRDYYAGRSHQNRQTRDLNARAELRRLLQRLVPSK